MTAQIEKYYFTAPTVSEILQSKFELASKLKLSLTEIDNLPYPKFEALCSLLK